MLHAVHTATPCKLRVRALALATASITELPKGDDLKRIGHAEQLVASHPEKDDAPQQRDGGDGRQHGVHIERRLVESGACRP